MSWWSRRRPGRDKWAKWLADRRFGGDAETRRRSQRELDTRMVCNAATCAARPDQAGTRNGSQLSRGWPGGRPAVGPRPYGQGTGTGGESLRESEQRRVVGAVRGATV